MISDSVACAAAVLCFNGAQSLNDFSSIRFLQRLISFRAAAFATFLNASIYEKGVHGLTRVKELTLVPNLGQLWGYNRKERESLSSTAPSRRPSVITFHGKATESNNIAMEQQSCCEELRHPIHIIAVELGAKHCCPPNRTHIKCSFFLPLGI